MSEIYVSILDDKQPELRKKSVPVTTPLSREDEKTLAGLLKYITDSHDETLREQYGLMAASGLAAPQIGINRDMITVFVEEEENGKTIPIRLALANPKIISHSVQSAYLKSGEGCLSVREPHEGYVPRHARITVKAYDYFTKKDIKIRAHGYLAIVLQHEIDHLSGIMFYDHINREDPFYEIPDAIVIE